MRMDGGQRAGGALEGEVSGIPVEVVDDGGACQAELWGEHPQRGGALHEVVDSQRVRLATTRCRCPRLQRG